MRKVSDGWIYTVPVGLTLHCAQCSVKLKSTEEYEAQCFVQDKDSSSVYCLKHIPAPRPRRAIVRRQPEPQPLWMAYET